MIHRAAEPERFRAWSIILRVLIAVALLFAAEVIWFERDGGKTLVHTILIELTEDRYLLAKISRPLSAQSLDQRPAIIFVSDRPWNRWTSVWKTSALTKRGIVTLAVEPITHGDRRELAGTQGSETTLCELLKACVAFAKSQSFIADNGVIVEISRYSESDFAPCAESIEAEAVIVTDSATRETALCETGIESIRLTDEP